MSIKSTTIKNYIKDVGTKNQLFVFVGSDTKSTTSNSNQASLDVWKQSDFSIKVGQNSIYPVVPNVKWIQKRPYIPWSGTTENTGNYYVYNDQNQYVYLCVSDNENNRTDLRGENVSNIRPTHTVGIQRYSDGYSWKPLYRMTPSIERFITSKWIPVISFDLFDSEDQKSQLLQTQEFCDNATSTVGQCAIYAKTPLSTDDDSGTIEYLKGDLFTIAENITCSDCHYLMKNNDKFVSYFYEDTETVPTSIEIIDEYTLIGNSVEQNLISTASPYYYLYQVNSNDNLEEGSIVSAFINLGSFTTSQLLVTQENPELTVTSNTGTGARIRLKTGVFNETYIINGIEVINPGSGYKDTILSIDSSILSASITSTELLASISVNLDVIDGLAFDPVSVLNAQHVMIDARMDTTTIQNSGILLPTEVNFFGLLENPVGICGSTETPTASNLNKKLDYVFRTTVKAEVQNITSESLLPGSNEIYDIPYEQLGVDYTNIDTTITASQNVTPSGGTPTSYVEFKNLDYTKSNSLIGSQLSGPKGGAAKGGSSIVSILETPVFVQYTGKVLSTTKLDANIPVEDIDSVIFRINIVKGI
jgi:hypothetical protein